jgi:hypothetical protein
MSYVQRRGEIVWAVPPSTLSDEDIDQVIAELEAHLAGGIPYVLLFDLTGTGTPTALQRQKLTRHVRENTTRIRRWVRGVGVILTSPVARGVVTALFWVSPLPVPHRIFSARAAATDWADSFARASTSL